MQKMKAVLCTKYGNPDYLIMGEVKKPIPKKNEVCIKIYATSVTGSDIMIRNFKIPRWHPMGIMMGLMLGFTKPRNPILGMVLAGEVESAGENVKTYKTGDKVFGWTLGGKLRFGTYAEYMCLPEKSIITDIPPNTSYEEAAAIPYGGLLALYFLKKGCIENKEKVLIYGASGSIGTFAVQIAKYFDAEVTGICSTNNVEMVKSLGADKVIDYTKEDFSIPDEKYDLIMDAVPFGYININKLKKQCKAVLSENGIYVSINKGSPGADLDDLMFLKKLMEENKLKAVIDRTWKLEEMAEAHRYVDTGHKKGNVVIMIQEEGK